MGIKSVTIPACDGYKLGGTVYEPNENSTKTAVLIGSATAVPQQFYKRFASYLMSVGFTAVTFDYRGIGDSKPSTLRGFNASASDWAFQDITGALDWLSKTYAPNRLFFIGHSFAGQTAGMLPNAHLIDAMVTFSSQSGYWRFQGGWQKASVAAHVHLSMPLLAHTFGYMPWSKFSKAEDLPKGFALEWASWCRNPRYLLGDKSLPLERYQSFNAPVLAFSFTDDDWGTARSVDAMMTAYPNLTRRHVAPQDIGTTSIGHFGAFRGKSKQLWQDVVSWLEETIPQSINQRS